MDNDFICYQRPSLYKHFDCLEVDMTFSCPYTDSALEDPAEDLEQRLGLPDCLPSLHLFPLWEVKKEHQR